MKRCSCSCQLCSTKNRNRVQTKWFSSLVTLHVHSPHVFWRLYTLICNTVIMERNKHGILHVSISVVWFQKCVHIKSCLARGYITQAWRQVRRPFVPAPVKVKYTQARAHFPISLLPSCRKQCKFGDTTIKDETVGHVPTSVTVCLQTMEVHRNCDAPCDYTYTDNSKKQEVNLELS